MVNVITEQVALQVVDGARMNAFVARQGAHGRYPGMLVFQWAFGVNAAAREGRASGVDSSGHIKVAETHVPDDTYEKVRQQFNEKEMAEMTLAVATIKAWNRLAISARSIPGTYQPVKRELEEVKKGT